MDIAIGLPARPLDGGRDHVLSWAASADVGPFSSLVIGDRVIAPAHEALTALAAAAGVTRRIRLMASLVVGPTRETTLLARQSATIQALSGGRLSLGLGVGIREEDFSATRTTFHDRGRRFETQLAQIRLLWAGEGLDDGTPPTGIPLGDGGAPELLIGGYVDAVAGRVARWGDGFMAPGGGEPARMAAVWRNVADAWADAGRSGAPRWVAGTYFALGPDAAAQARRYIEAYYGYDPVVAARRLRDLPTTPRQVLDAIRRHADDGVDELIMRSVIADPAMRDRLADLVAP
jgi:alkanesulfonate monooxygenase SsuD/methylene tetrahydromethanopterin reductase-like flavin-dependent oxidoreductase (luciferase family)